MRASSPIAALALATLLLPAATRAGGEPIPLADARATGAARLPDTATGGDYWELLAAFDTGHLVFAQTLVTRVGWGGRKAAVVGALVEPGGKVRSFRRTENEDGFQLTRQGRTLDLNAAILEQRDDARRLRVRKSGLTVEVAVDSPRPGLALPEAVPGCEMDVLEVASPARGSLRDKGDNEATLLETGHASFTHRWLEALEADCATRRLEIYVQADDLGVYASELLTPKGERHAFAVVHRGGQAIFADRPARLEVAWNARKGKPSPREIELEAGGLRVRLSEVGSAAIEMDLLERVPRLFRPVLALKTQPSVRIQPARFTAEDASGSAGSGRAWLKTLYLNEID